MMTYDPHKQPCAHFDRSVPVWCVRSPGITHARDMMYDKCMTLAVALAEQGVRARVTLQSVKTCQPPRGMCKRTPIGPREREELSPDLDVFVRAQRYYARKTRYGLPRLGSGLY